MTIPAIWWLFVGILCCQKLQLCDNITTSCFCAPPQYRDNDFDYLEFRLWIGLWSAFFCLVLVATDASFLVQYFTRFTEEGFSCLISFIFIYDAFKKMLKLAHHYPINSDYKWEYVLQYDCLCMAPTILGEMLFNFEAFGWHRYPDNEWADSVLPMDADKTYSITITVHGMIPLKNYPCFPRSHSFIRTSSKCRQG